MPFENSWSRPGRRALLRGLTGGALTMAAGAPALATPLGSVEDADRGVPLDQALTGVRFMFHCGNSTFTEGWQEFFGVHTDGRLVWYRYLGEGRGGSWQIQPIGTGWQNVTQAIGYRDRSILAITREGLIHWYNLWLDVDEDTGLRVPRWTPNSGNPVGSGWGHFERLISLSPYSYVDSTHTQLAVEPSGYLRWYSYRGHGEHDPAGRRWAANSGNIIGSGWSGMQHVQGAGNVIFAVDGEGDLRWYSYSGRGRRDPNGRRGWHANSGNVIGNGWNGIFHMLVGHEIEDGRHRYDFFCRDAEPGFRWYRYYGEGEQDRGATRGWHANSGRRLTI